jgi:hypothetical protein
LDIAFPNISLVTARETSPLNIAEAKVKLLTQSSLILIGVNSLVPNP